MFLLHIVNLNIVAPESCVFRELADEAKSYLEQLADRYLPPVASAVAHVRIGEPVQEILAQAAAEKPDLIILPTYDPSFWTRSKAVWNPACNPIVSPLAEQVIRQATCGVFAIAAKTSFNCETAWGRPRTSRPNPGNERAESSAARIVTPPTLHSWLPAASFLILF